MTLSKIKINNYSLRKKTAELEKKRNFKRTVIHILKKLKYADDEEKNQSQEQNENYKKRNMEIVEV